MVNCSVWKAYVNTIRLGLWSGITYILNPNNGNGEENKSVIGVIVAGRLG